MPCETLALRDRVQVLAEVTQKERRRIPSARRRPELARQVRRLKRSLRRGVPTQ